MRSQSPAVRAYPSLRPEPALARPDDLLDVLRREPHAAAGGTRERYLPRGDLVAQPVVGDVEDLRRLPNRQKPLAHFPSLFPCHHWSPTTSAPDPDQLMTPVRHPSATVGGRS